MLDEREVIAAKFRQLSRIFGERSGKTFNCSDLQKFTNYLLKKSEAGEIIVHAVQSQYLIHPDISELVASLDDRYPMLSPATRYEALFNEIAGNYQQDGTPDGFLPKLFPEILKGWPNYDWPNSIELLNRFSHEALICEILAEIVTKGDPAESCDRYCYYEAMRKTPWRAIMETVNKTPGWSCLGSENHAKQCAKRFAEKHHLPPILKRKSGRPKNTN
jgi:hypothetical protein